MEQIIKNTIEGLKKNNFDVKYFETSKEAVQEILKEIKAEDTVGIGGSMTIKDLELDTLLKERGNTVYWHWLEANVEDMNKARRTAAQADVYLTSSNALTQDGKLVNTDGMGNRVSAMFYGPKKTIVVCGKNKITENVDAALERIEKNAYKNARRLKLNTPCAINESCIDCSSPQRMCNITTIIRKKPTQKDFTVVLINEELGY
ncbi:MAG: Transcriptional regulator of sugar metabolism [Clostridia bacterium]|jgi:L-lactate utilization protein LutC|nr:Transcriptional regulator of sugar metabolism [Clostridia bacterium]